MHFLTHLFVLGAAKADAAAASTSGSTSSAAWALVIFLVFLGMLVTLASSRRVIEVKRPKDE